MPNLRIRGKIPRHEWSKIAARFQNGATLAQIARSYHCTPPAVRYILGRISIGAGRGEIDGNGLKKLTELASSRKNRRGSARVQGSEDRFYSPEDRGRSSQAGPVKDIWSRINTDIATFLAAMDSRSWDDSNDAYEALLAATDRLLKASARTRLELERILGERESVGAVARISGSRAS